MLGPLLFLLYVNDLHHASKVLNLSIFAEDTNLIFSHSDINILFEKLNKQLTNESNWFNANKLLLNIKMTKYSFFYKSSKKITFGCSFRIWFIKGFTVESESSLKFLGVWVDGNLTRRYYIIISIILLIIYVYIYFYVLYIYCIYNIFVYIHIYMSGIWTPNSELKILKDLLEIL